MTDVSSPRREHAFSSNDLRQSDARKLEVDGHEIQTTDYDTLRQRPTWLHMSDVNWNVDDTRELERGPEQDARQFQFTTLTPRIRRVLLKSNLRPAFGDGGRHAGEAWWSVIDVRMMRTRVSRTTTPARSSVFFLPWTSPILFHGGL